MLRQVVLTQLQGNQEEAPGGGTVKPGPSQRQGWAWPSVVGSRLEAATTSMVSRRLRALHSTATAQHSHSTAQPQHSHSDAPCRSHLFACSPFLPRPQPGCLCMSTAWAAGLTSSCTGTSTGLSASEGGGGCSSINAASTAAGRAAAAACPVHARPPRPGKASPRVATDLHKAHSCLLLFSSHPARHSPQKQWPQDTIE